ncbi:iron-sulfur cluster assembly protein [Neomegalonema sp.]|uniref:iron-sulfur cluster assembly protein n=1 Tax=Neomegalonema sp. TaxID=2039713 RepID=UPI0026304BF6|nr:iron-sulfur cluster assembly protein [Neomegalonema sp.]MDD2869977.1 iron-sulfur cluster assembly protein [Neomegalonema sp.]
MNAPHVYDIRAREVWRRLAAVTDPELDEPITEMGFVERLEVSQAGEVEVDFRLPSYWCSPNFAFLMADGIHCAASEPSWVSRVRVELKDHCFADRVNDAVNGGRSFEAVFAELTEGADLSEIRQIFREKAFLRRQESVIRGLIAMGWSPARIAGLTFRGFDALDLGGQPEAAAQKPRYRELLRAEGLACAPEDPVFTTWSGEPLTAGGLGEHLMRLRTLRINMEFNGALCRGLASTRYKEVDRSGGEPELIDFILGRVSPRPSQESPVSRG